MVSKSYLVILTFCGIAHTFKIPKSHLKLCWRFLRFSTVAASRFKRLIISHSQLPFWRCCAFIGGAVARLCDWRFSWQKRSLFYFSYGHDVAICKMIIQDKQYHPQNASNLNTWFCCVFWSLYE